METLRERQDRDHAARGFTVGGDYELPRVTKDDHDTLSKLRDLAREVGQKDEILAGFANTGYFYESMVFYGRNRQGLREFAKQLRESGRTGIPDDGLFDRLDILCNYEGIKRFISTDGGETSEGVAYMENGMTVKEGFVRFYWK